uniref:Uncharacterized protein n=1 Tax=Oryza barthii TaxID=65489 RepID=A0A0D3HRU6_9ORYZ
MLRELQALCRVHGLPPVAPAPTSPTASPLSPSSRGVVSGGGGGGDRGEVGWEGLLEAARWRRGIWADEEGEVYSRGGRGGGGGGGGGGCRDGGEAEKPEAGWESAGGCLLLAAQAN